ncbi:MAG: hypothetical protein E7029_00535 [Planctomycetaceae bacterium]|nr:hypothetical protein [Planctomycetaceae bacterium]
MKFPISFWQSFPKCIFRLFRKVHTDPGSDLTTENTKETQTHTEKKEKRKKGSERTLTRISRKTRKAADALSGKRKKFSKKTF